jgi:teichuronic acid biosynthesis glycosyltransferase TuaH
VPPGRSRILFASHSAEVGSFRVGSHHLSAALARLGHRAVHLATPLSIANLLSRDPGKGVRQRFDSALRRANRDSYDRLSIVPISLIPVQLTASWQRNVALATIVPPLHRRLRRAGIEEMDYTLIDQPMFQGIWHCVPTLRVVYRPTDIFAGGPWDEAQRRVLARADAVVATSDAVLESLELTRAIPTLVLPNGVDFARFATTEAEPAASGGAVYAGALDLRLDWSWLCRLAEAVPDVPFTIAGPSREVPNLPPNVTMIGPVRYDAVPSLLRAATVGLLPFTDSVLNSGRSPMKLYEYLAAGAYVVGSRFSASTGLERLPGVTLTGDTAEAASAVREALGKRHRNIEGQRVAAGQNWDAKARLLEGFLAGLR